MDWVVNFRQQTENISFNPELSSHYLISAPWEEYKYFKQASSSTSPVKLAKFITNIRGPFLFCYYTDQQTG